MAKTPNIEALRNVVRALKESPDPEAFNMGNYVNKCGTPACCLGHYASRPDLQTAFTIDRYGNLIAIVDTGEVSPTLRHISYDELEVLEHFGITEVSVRLLFSSAGCGFADTAQQAITYLEQYIERQESSHG